jgi:hypothetical protein
MGSFLEKFSTIFWAKKWAPNLNKYAPKGITVTKKSSPIGWGQALYIESNNKFKNL